MAILVTGGAGYIGSVTVEELRRIGEDVVVLDNLVYGHRSAVDESASFYEGDIGNSELVSKILVEHEVSSCMHFSAYAYVGESVENPGKYFENNVEKTIRLLNTLVAKGIRYFVFSSTCATYGEPAYIPIDEKHPQEPTSPYGLSKLMVEKILESYQRAYGLEYVSLRYFNASGATAKRGEHHEPETHLIPLVLEVASGKRESISIFGDDYPTPDGTAIRDYIHVSDLAQAHVLALQHLGNEGQSEMINLGNGEGYSVREVIDTARQVTGKDIRVKIVDRRAGDPSRLVGDAQKAKDVLGWRPEFASLESIIESAWKWHRDNPAGYSD